MFADDPSSDNGQWVPVEVDEVVRSRADATSPAFHAVVLRDHGGRRVPIYIGDAEATALAFSLETVETPRPMTYAMASRLVKASGARVTDVRITRLADRTVFAVVTVDTSSGRQEVDARPSDALNLALVASAPVFVESSAFDALASCALREWQHFPDRARDLVSEAQDRHTTVMTLAEAAMRRQDDSEVAPSGRDERQS